MAINAAQPRCWQNKGPVSLDEVLTWSLDTHRVDTLLVVERKTVDQRGREAFEPGVASTVKSLFRKHLVKRLNARAWPGTEVVEGTERVYVVRFDRALKDQMVKTESELFEWRHTSPKLLPEDICVFRAGSKHPVFASTTHERHAFAITASANVPRGFEATGYSISELMLAWDGPYFCLV